MSARRTSTPSPETASSSGSPNWRPSTEAAISAERGPASSRSMRATITFSTVGGTSTATS